METLLRGISTVQLLICLQSWKNSSSTSTGWRFAFAINCNDINTNTDWGSNPIENKSKKKMRSWLISSVETKRSLKSKKQKLVRPLWCRQAHPDGRCWEHQLRWGWSGTWQLLALHACLEPSGDTVLISETLWRREECLPMMICTHFDKSGWEINLLNFY